MPKAMTKEAVREIFLQELHRLVEYWASPHVPRDTCQERLDGLAFSFLNILDGTSSSLPSLDIVLRPHPNDEEFHKREDEDWFQDGMVINGDCYLHDLWGQRIEPPTIHAGETGVETDIAVVEYINYLGEWESLFAIGPDRSEGVIDEYGNDTYRGCELRIRYLNRGIEPPR